jgi:enamine deaminase RidA (YjgF/YER057c/UK114 family)
VGEVYREIIGVHFPVMTIVEISKLLEKRAKLEIETTAVIPE